MGEEVADYTGKIVLSLTSQQGDHIVHCCTKRCTAQALIYRPAGLCWRNPVRRIMTNPTVKLSSGYAMPVVGLGTFDGFEVCFPLFPHRRYIWSVTSPEVVAVDFKQKRQREDPSSGTDSLAQTVRTQTVRTQTVRTQTVRTQTVRTQTVRTQTVRTQTVRTQTVRTQTVRTQTVRTQTVRTQTVRTQTVRAASLAQSPIPGEDSPPSC